MSIEKALNANRGRDVSLVAVHKMNGYIRHEPCGIHFWNGSLGEHQELSWRDMNDIGFSDDEVIRLRASAHVVYMYADGSASE